MVITILLYVLAISGGLYLGAIAFSVYRTARVDRAWRAYNRLFNLKAG